MDISRLIDAQALMKETAVVLLDCRFSLADADEGHRQYLQGHIPGALYIDLNRDLSGPVGEHGGRHPLPPPATLAASLARCGIDRDTAVVAYDDSGLAFAARLWWLMRSLGYREPRLLNGGLGSWLAAGGALQTGEERAEAVPVPVIESFRGACDIDGLRAAQAAGTSLVDSREPRRYAGLEEPIDPIAGHIPGAVNRPWQGVTGGDGQVLSDDGLRQHWGDLLDEDSLVVYCGSGVTACVNLFSLALLGREDDTLYAGSWSDWCSYL